VCLPTSSLDVALVERGLQGKNVRGGGLFLSSSLRAEAGNLRSEEMAVQLLSRGRRRGRSRNGGGGGGKKRIESI